MRKDYYIKLLDAANQIKKLQAGIKGHMPARMRLADVRTLLSKKTLTQEEQNFLWEVEYWLARAQLWLRKPKETRLDLRIALAKLYELRGEPHVFNLASGWDAPHSRSRDARECTQEATG